MESFGAPDQAFVVVPHPLGMIPKDEVRAKADKAFPEIVKAATSWKQTRMTIPGAGKAPYPLDVIKFKGTYADLNKMFFEKKLSLGLPVVPPTREAVARMLKGTSHKPGEVIWDSMPPRNGIVTTELVAATGVMAGCKPETMPLLLAIVDGLKSPSANPIGFVWRAQTTTTHPTAPLIMVNGPIVKQLGISNGTGAMGPEQPVNLCLGYFINLLGDVAGGSRPPDADKSTQGWVGNTIATVLAENEDLNPWKQSFAVERGFKPTDNVLTLAGGGPPISQNDHASVEPQDLAEVMAHTMNAVGSNRCFLNGGVWLVGPEHAATLARKGWTKKDVKEFLWKNARAPLKVMPPKVDGKCSITSCCPPKEFGEVTPDTLIPVCHKADQIDIVVVGGPGKQSQWWSYGEFSHIPPTMINIDKWK